MAEIVVTSTADSGAGSLRQAIADANSGDVILFDADVFPVGQTTSILLSSYIAVNKSISIYGGASDGNGGYTSGAVKSYYVYRDVENVRTKVNIASPAEAEDDETVLFTNVCRVALDGQGAARCLTSTSSTGASFALHGLEITNGATTSGGGIYMSNTAACNLYDCNITNCTATSGGGVYSSGTSQNTLTDCTISGCSANYGGGLYSNNTSQNTLNDCTISGCSASSGGGLYSKDTSQNTLNGCTVRGCNVTDFGGGLYAINSSSSSQNTLNNCTITDCSATTNGGGVYSGSTSQNTLNDCTISGCSANYGGGLYSTNTSQNTLNGCQITNCSSNEGGGIYTRSSSQCELNNSSVVNCTASTRGPGIYTGDISTLTINALHADDLRLANAAFLNVAGGVSIVKNGDLNSTTVTIADGAALSITTSSTIGAATFTSEGRGYLAVGAGIDTSAATLTNVVLCAYGADVSSFAEVDGVLEWEAANPTTTVLIERADGDSWSTVAQPTGGTYDLYLPPSDAVRLFDGVRFFTATAPEQRTYYYIGGSEGSFTSAADWSLRRGGTAITEAPVVAGQRFIIGDIEETEQEG